MMHECKSREERGDECATDENYAWNVVQLSAHTFYGIEWIVI